LGLNDLYGDIDPKNILYDPTLKDWDDLTEDERNRLRNLYPHLFDENGEFIYNHKIPDWMNFGPIDGKYGPLGLIKDGDDEGFNDDDDDLSSLASDEVYSIDENGKRYKRKKKGFGDGNDDLDE